LERRYHQPTLWDAFLRYLATNGYEVPPEMLERDVTQPVEPAPAVQETLIQVYRQDPTLTQVCERLVDLDEGFQEWRYRHIKMVERTIGAKQGTGGSAGVKYLETTLLKPVFPDLWAIRTVL
jgi:tryptophan 2,3-dioxygenase